MKSRTFLLVLALMGGCASSPTILYSGAPLPADQVAVLTSAYTPDNLEMIRRVFADKPYYQVSDGFRSSVIVAVDGQIGTHSYGVHNNMFNNFLDMSYNIHVAEGQHALIVSSNVGNALDAPSIQIQLNAVRGHRYFVGQMVERAGLQKYRFKPLIIDIAENKLVYPRTAEIDQTN